MFIKVNDRSFGGIKPVYINTSAICAIDLFEKPNNKGDEYLISLNSGAYRSVWINKTDLNRVLTALGLPTI